MNRVALLLALLPSCSASFESPPLGDPFYQTATICTRADLYQAFADGAAEWHAMAPSVAMDVEVGWTDNCDVYADWNAVPEDGGTLPGIIYIDPSMRPYMEEGGVRVVATHELGHVLIGKSNVAHSADPESVMHSPGNRYSVVKPEDAAKIRDPRRGVAP